MAKRQVMLTKTLGFSRPEIFKRNRKNMVIEKGVVAFLYDVKEDARLADIGVVTKDGLTEYFLSSIPIKYLEETNKPPKSKTFAKQQAGWIYGRLHAKPVQVIRVKADSNRGKTMGLESRRSASIGRSRTPRITPRVGRLS